jgi:actin-related protein
MLGHYKFKGVHVATQAVLTLYAQGITTGIVLDRFNILDKGI